MRRWRPGRRADRGGPVAAEPDPLGRLIEDLLDRAAPAHRRALARTLTLLEGTGETGEGAARLRRITAAVHPHGGGAHIIGVTGAPGVGKSTLTAAIVEAQRRRGRTVAVLAVDPSSPFSGGALLGDRIRMGGSELDDGVYIRSMATRGHLGGLSWAAPHAVTVLDAAGFDVVLVETVGVGQAELEIADVADSTVVVLAPGMGDAVQAAKAGILEIADLFVVNKADRPDAARTARELRGALDAAEAGAWTPPILTTVATDSTGVEALIAALDAHREFCASEQGAPLGAERRRRAAEMLVREILLDRTRQRLAAALRQPDAAAVIDEVVARRRDPYAAADALAQRAAFPDGAGADAPGAGGAAGGDSAAGAGG